MKNGLVWLMIIVTIVISGCTAKDPVSSGGSEVYENPWGRTVIVPGEVATFGLTATYNVGFAIIIISLTNISDEVLIPRIVGEPNGYYCYLVTIKDQDGNPLDSRPFNLEEFENQFGDDQLWPGLTYSEWEWIWPLSLPNNPYGGIVKADVWLFKEDMPDTTYHMWGQVSLAIEWP